MLKYSTAPIVVPDAAVLDALAEIQPGQRLVYGYEVHPVYSPLASRELSERAHAIVTALEGEYRLLRFMRRQGNRFAYIGVGVEPVVHKRLLGALERVKLPERYADISFTPKRKKRS